MSAQDRRPRVGEIWMTHAADLVRIREEYVYEWSVEWLDGTTGRLEREDLEPVSSPALWLLAGMAPKPMIRGVVRADNYDETGD